MSLAVALKTQITWLMYAPNHGWSLCDSHAGVLNQQVSKAELNGEAPDTAEKLQRLISISKVDYTYPVVFLVNIEI